MQETSVLGEYLRYHLLPSVPMKPVAQKCRGWYMSADLCVTPNLCPPDFGLAVSLVSPTKSNRNSNQKEIKKCDKLTRKGYTPTFGHLTCRWHSMYSICLPFPFCDPTVVCPFLAHLCKLHGGLLCFTFCLSVHLSEFVEPASQNFFESGVLAKDLSD